MFSATKTKLGGTNDPITLNTEDIQNLINAEVKNDIARNILSQAPKKNTEEFRTDIKTPFKIQDINLARKMKDEIFLKYENEKKF